jgi:hypothetical protein
MEGIGKGVPVIGDAVLEGIQDHLCYSTSPDPSLRVSRFADPSLTHPVAKRFTWSKLCCSTAGLLEDRLVVRFRGLQTLMVVRRAHGVNETAHSSDAQDVGQRPESGKADVLERLPVARDGVGVEEDAAGSDLQRAGKVLSLVLEVEPVLSRTS